MGLRIARDSKSRNRQVEAGIEAYDRVTVKWPQGTPVDTLRFLMEARGMTATDLSRLLGTDRSLGPKILRGERRLTVDHVRILAWYCGRISTCHRKSCSMVSQ